MWNSTVFILEHCLSIYFSTAYSRVKKGNNSVDIYGIFSKVNQVI